jgi:hypothetical protein
VYINSAFALDGSVIKIILDKLPSEHRNRVGFLDESGFPVQMLL